MAEQFLLAVEGLQSLAELETLPANIVRAAKRAVNDATRKGRTEMDREIHRQVAFPSGYLSPRTKRLFIDEFATDNKLSASILGRARPTSLARFAKDNTPVGGARRAKGVRVEVEPYSVKRLPGAFLIKLRAGTAALETKNNLGLAVRTKNGRAPPGYRPVKLAENLWLLYGPSVAQVLHSERNAGGVATTLSPEIAQNLETEFLRQLDLK